MDREAWRASIHGVAKSRTRLIYWTELNWTETQIQENNSHSNRFLALMDMLSYFHHHSHSWLTRFKHFNSEMHLSESISSVLHSILKYSLPPHILETIKWPIFCLTCKKKDIKCMKRIKKIRAEITYWENYHGFVSRFSLSGIYNFGFLVSI